MARKILLGDGISAKIFSFYNPEYVRIAPRYESQVDKVAFLPSILIHQSQAVDNFFTDLGMDAPRQLALPIGWIERETFHSGNPPRDVRDRIIARKLNSLEKPPSLFSTVGDGTDDLLCQAASDLVTYDLPLGTLLKTLNDELRTRSDFIEARVTSISDTEVILDSGQRLEYSHLVSTMPAYIFWEVYCGKHAEKKVFHSFPLYVRRMKRHLWASYAYPALPERGICYFPETKYAFDRVLVVPEFQGDEYALEGPETFDGAAEVKSARIIRNYGNIAPPNVMFLGRYAQWNPDVVTSDVVKRSSQKYLADDIWSDQKAFNRRFVNYTPDAQYVQGVVKNYVLHVMSELGSLLDTINWKVGATTVVKMERDRILEEWIDVFKFWLSIGHMFGFDVGDFERMYWEKTKQVKERYGNV